MGSRKNRGNGGYWMVPRAGVEHPRYSKRPFDEWHAWQDIIQRAEWRDGEAIKRGSLLITTRELAKAWGWNNIRVWRFLKRLSRGHDAPCVTASVTGGVTGAMLVSLRNYDRYQTPATYNVTASVTASVTGGRARSHGTKTCRPLNSSKQREPRINKHRPNPETGRPEPAPLDPDAEEGEKQEDEMPELPDVVTEGPMLIHAAARAVVAWQKAGWPAHSKLPMRGPSAMEFEAIKKAVVDEKGDWRAVADGYAGIAAECIARNFQPKTIAYATTTWTSRGAQRETERAIAEAQNEPEDQRVRELVRGLAAKAAVTERDPRRRPDDYAPPPPEYTPEERAYIAEFQAKLRAEREANAREVKREMTEAEWEEGRKRARVVIDSLNAPADKTAH